MSARPAPSLMSHHSIAARAYFDHRQATGGTIEMLVSLDLEVLWLSIAALSLGARMRPFSLGSDRLLLSSRAEEDRLRAFLGALNQSAGAWVLDGPDAWLIHAEPITPPEMERAWLLTWRRMASPDRYLWGDVGAALRLTPAETRMLMLLLQGLPADEAARRQSITVETARTHIRRIYAKTGASNRGQLFALALPYRWG